MIQGKVLCIITCFYSLISPIIMLFGGDQLNYHFSDNRLYYRISIIILLLLLEGLNITIMTISRHPQKCGENIGCLLLIASIIGFFGVLYFFSFWSESMF